MIKKVSTDLNLKNIRIQDGFFSPLQELVKHVVIPYQEQILNDEIPNAEKSHAIENFRIAAGEQEGEFYGMVFQDSDVAKWLEAVAYSLAIEPNAELEKRADDLIDLIGRAQQDDGYLNTYFTVKEPNHRWQNLQECHELYCAGHLLEAAVAYYECTGKDKFLNIMKRMCDHIDARFGPNKTRGIPGHEEIELALLRLYNTTGEEKYLNLSKYFIDERGAEPDFFIEEAKNRGWVHFNMNPEDRKYPQNHAPVREQDTAEGHSVRAMYLYTAMADLAARTDDKPLLDACERLWDNTVNKRMYLTAGIGSTVEGEAFSIDYDLPNDTIYAETCASIGLIFFAKKMLETTPKAKYADIMERAFYNGTISGMQLDGKRFFYVNPLEVNPKVSGELYGFKHVLPQRPGWYACACCPPNVARLLTSLGQYVWAENETTIFSHLFAGGTAQFAVGGGVSVDLTSNYPWDGNLNYTVNPAVAGTSFTMAIRIPQWCKKATLSVNGESVSLDHITKDGYAYLNRNWNKNDTISLILDMPVVKIYANTAVRADAGCVALMRGPMVYAFESMDNGDELQALRIPRNAVTEVLPFDKTLLGGVVPITVEGIRFTTSDSLYSECPPTEQNVTLKAVPYYTWGNRGLGQMRVWMLEK